MVLDNHSLSISFVSTSQIGHIKQSYNHLSLARCLPSEYRGFLDHIETCSYPDRPDYGMIRSLIQQAMVRRDIRESDPYDWEADAATAAATTTADTVGSKEAKNAASRPPLKQQPSENGGVGCVGGPSYLETAGGAVAAAGGCGATNYEGTMAVTATTNDAAAPCWTRHVGRLTTATATKTDPDAPEPSNNRHHLYGSSSRRNGPSSPPARVRQPSSNSRAAAAANFSSKLHGDPTRPSATGAPPLGGASRSSAAKQNIGASSTRQRSQKHASEVVAGAMPPLSMRKSRDHLLVSGGGAGGPGGGGHNSTNNHHRQVEDFPRATSLPLATRFRSQQRGRTVQPDELQREEEEEDAERSVESVAGATHAMALSIAPSRFPGCSSRLNSGSMTQMAGLGLSSQDLLSFVGDDFGNFTDNNNNNNHATSSHMQQRQSSFSSADGWRSETTTGGTGNARFPRPAPRCSNGRISTPPHTANYYSNSVRTRRRCDSPAHWTPATNTNNSASVPYDIAPQQQQSTGVIRRWYNGSGRGSFRRSLSHTKLDSSGNSHRGLVMVESATTTAAATGMVRPDSPFCSWCTHHQQQNQNHQQSSDIDSPPAPLPPPPQHRSRSSSRASMKLQQHPQQALRSPRVFFPQTDKMTTTNLDEIVDESASRLLKCSLNENGAASVLLVASPRPPEFPVSPSGREAMAARRRKYRPQRVTTDRTTPPVYAAAAVSTNANNNYNHTATTTNTNISNNNHQHLGDNEAVLLQQQPLQASPPAPLFE